MVAPHVRSERLCDRPSGVGFVWDGFPVVDGNRRAGYPIRPPSGVGKSAILVEINNGVAAGDFQGFAYTRVDRPESINPSLTYEAPLGNAAFGHPEIMRGRRTSILLGFRRACVGSELRALRLDVGSGIR